MQVNDAVVITNHPSKRIVGLKGTIIEIVTKKNTKSKIIYCVKLSVRTRSTSPYIFPDNTIRCKESDLTIVVPQEK